VKRHRTLVSRVCHFVHPYIIINVSRVPSFTGVRLAEARHSISLNLAPVVYRFSELALEDEHEAIAAHTRNFVRVRMDRARSFGRPAQKQHLKAVFNKHRAARVFFSIPRATLPEEASEGMNIAALQTVSSGVIWRNI